MKPGTGPSWFAITLAAVLSACSSLPGPADVPEIMSEAAGTKPEPRWGDSDARRAVRMSARSMLRFDSVHVAEVSRRFARPELYDYLLRPESFVGGLWPGKTAVLLREVQQVDREYVFALRSFPVALYRRLAETDLSEDRRRVFVNEMSAAFLEQQQPVVDAVEAFDDFIGVLAEMYELAAEYRSSIRLMRDDLRIVNGRVRKRYNSLVDRANSAHAVAESAIRQLEPLQQVRFARMRVLKPAKA